jgi:hypothetical protein
MARGGKVLVNRASHILCALFITAIMLQPSIMDDSSGAEDKTLSVRKEWTSEKFGNCVWFESKDIDRDGTPELLAWVEQDDNNAKGLGRIRVYDQPGYALRYSADMPGAIHLKTIDLQGDGVQELLIVSTGIGNSNITIISGNEFKTLWHSPDFFDGPIHYQISDIDADGEDEIVWFGMYDNGSSGMDHIAVRIHAFGASSFKEKMNVPGIDGWTDEFSLVNLDGDPAQEFVFLTHEMRGNTLAATRIRVVDGNSHCVQWETADEPAVQMIVEPQFEDIDNDGETEIVTAFMENDTTGGTTSSVRVFSGGDGCLEWCSWVGSNINTVDIADINADAGMELLVAADSTINPWAQDGETTLKVFGPRDGRELWSVGPFPRHARMGTDLYASDLDGDRCAEIVITNFSAGKDWTASKASHTVLDGSNFTALWTSPQYGGKKARLDAFDQDNDGVPEYMVPDTIVGADGKLTGRLHIFSGVDYSEEWTSDVFIGGVVDAECVRVTGDPRPELVISTLVEKNGTAGIYRQKYILDGETRKTLWSSPCRPEIEFEAANIVDGPGFELFCIGNTWKQAGSKTEMFLYDCSGFTRLWSSGDLSGSLDLKASGDIDGDGRGEVLTITERDKDNRVLDFQLTAWEFSIPLGLEPVPADGSTTLPDETAESTEYPANGGDSSVVLIAGAITIVSASTGAVAFMITRKKGKRAPNVPGGDERLPALPVLETQQDRELRS